MLYHRAFIRSVLLYIDSVVFVWKIYRWSLSVHCIPNSSFLNAGIIGVYHRAQVGTCFSFDGEIFVSVQKF